MTVARRALVLVNRKSRRGSEAIDAALGLLAEGGVQLIREDCLGPADLPGVIAGRAKKVDLVILGGGDGTLNCAAGSLLKTGLPLGLLPLGTANDLARTLGIPVDLEAAARIILGGSLREIDLGQVNDQYFFNVASIGLSASLTRVLTPDLKRRWGRLGYAVATVRALARHHPFYAEIVGAGATRRIRTTQIAVGNGVFYGGGLMVHENASIDDGQLDLYSLEVRSRWRLALLYPAFRRGRQGMWTEVRTLHAGALEIRTAKPRSINTDGELTTTTPATFRVLPKAIKVFAPPPAKDTAL